MIVSSGYIIAPMHIFKPKPYYMLLYYHKPSINFQSLAVMVSSIEKSSIAVTCHEILQIYPFALLWRQ